jgi:hypothetical protein
MTPLERAAVGFSTHTGWAAAVVLAGTAERPRVVFRSRIELLEGTDRFVFHRAAELDLAAAERLVQHAEEVSRRKAREGLRALLDPAQVRLVAAGIVGGNARVPSDLAAVLRSHALVHAAEGELFRGALAFASEEAGLKVTAVPSQKLHARAAAALGLPEADLAARIADLRRGLGPPWGKDQKDGAAVAWLALAGA